MRLTQAQIVAFSAATVLVPAADDQAAVVAFHWDSRNVQPNTAFIALPGERTDGNDYLQAALQAGASCLLASRRPSSDIWKQAQARGAALLLVEDAQQALFALAGAARQLLPAKVVAITGSSGKTSTKELAAAVLRAADPQLTVSGGNHNNEVGLPATILAANPDSRLLVLEMGMYGLGEIAQLAAVAKPEVGIITNIGVAHLELLGSRENIARAKAELISALPDRSGVAILPGDDPYTPFIRATAAADQRELRILSYGLGPQNDIRASDIAYDQLGRPSFTLKGLAAAPVGVTLQLQGEHSVRNALAAAAAGIVCGLNLEQIAAALAAAEPFTMRQVNITLPNGTLLIDDTYNANPDSMRAALEVLASIEDDRPHIAVLGDMLELGPDELQLHADIGQQAAASGIDLLLAVGERSRAMAAAARRAGMPQRCVICVPDARAAADYLLSKQRDAAVILVKASRGLGLEKVVQALC
ncbi:MAG: UDP-N-acetylmuramoyl-tripeptide--D-alanyl-D-alanine ligase [Coriobacteriales bacterium]|jgi:UDP-N-acetylmuramoyl-tripeptide--D-alanyl-D-alanine ligase|nr:UDP-N-acetylmuramoyl-tripeptide--D-alanyl-D-alanine ligase [Coriobacteriales bacterium]